MILFKASAIYGSLVVTTFENVITANELESWNQIKRLVKGGDSYSIILSISKLKWLPCVQKNVSFFLSEWEWKCRILAVLVPFSSSLLPVVAWGGFVHCERTTKHCYLGNGDMFYSGIKSVLLHNISYWSQRKGHRGITQPGFLSIWNIFYSVSMKRVGLYHFIIISLILTVMMFVFRSAAVWSK